MGNALKLSDINLLFKRSLLVSAVDKIQQIVKPLKVFNISYFSYNVHYFDGTHFMMNNYPGFTRYYYEKNLFTYCGLVKHYLPEGVFLTHWLNDERIFSVDRMFNMSPGLVIIEHHDQFAEYFHFSMTADKEGKMPELLNYINYLYRFIAYFKDSVSSLIEEGHKSRYEFPVLNIFKDYYQKFPKTCDCNKDLLTQSCLNEFIRNTEFKRFYLDFKNNYLTQRELDVLDLLKRGKNTQKICKQLAVSSKTIEMHVKNIKDKLNCKTLFSLGFNLAGLENKGIFL